ncbi:MAG: lysoplasmalogenase [Erysipelotrichaceae bacterium]|nr:lysoplasmalogenase [Erysipelotrichaceae bacterium]
MTYLIMIVGIMIDLWFIYEEARKEMKRSVVLKGLASLMFVVAGYLMYTKNPSGAGKLILYGLIFGMLGDIFLQLRNVVDTSKSNLVFAVGILFFLIGHGFYIAMMLGVSPSLDITAICFGVTFAIFVPFIMKRVTPPSVGLKYFGYVYLAIVIAMFSCAAGVLVSNPGAMSSVLFVIGACLFMVSDFVMIYNSFGPKPTQTLRTTNLLTYYFGQLLIAFCISLL